MFVYFCQHLTVIIFNHSHTCLSLKIVLSLPRRLCSHLSSSRSLALPPACSASHGSLWHPCSPSQSSDSLDLQIPAVIHMLITTKKICITIPSVPLTSQPVLVHPKSMPDSWQPSYKGRVLKTHFACPTRWNWPISKILSLKLASFPIISIKNYVLGPEW